MSPWTSRVTSLPSKVNPSSDLAARPGRYLELFELQAAGCRQKLPCIPFCFRFPRERSPTFRHPGETSVSRSRKHFLLSSSRRKPGPRLSTRTHAESLGPDFRRGDGVHKISSSRRTLPTFRHPGGSRDPDLERFATSLPAIAVSGKLLCP